MLVADFDYDLPKELIAQTPLEPRDHSRLLVVDPLQQTHEDKCFYDIGEFLNSGDLLVFNDTRVIPARLYAHRGQVAGAKVEVFLLKMRDESLWECLVRPGKRARIGDKLLFEGEMSGEVVAVEADGSRVVSFDPRFDFHEWLLQYGETPLPPYIHADAKQYGERYQTVYSKNEGSVAAPTAGLHFTPKLLEQLANQGIETGFLTLHVGIGTFRPVQTEVVEEHQMHSEWFTLSAKLVDQIKQTKAKGGRVFAVGTTTVRVLESQANEVGLLTPGSGETSIFIYPGYKFKVIDGLITNFHLPKSSLLMLVSALAGREFIMECYQYAIQQQYRFFSFGDAMLIKSSPGSV